MKVWGNHTKGMDHLHRRAESLLEKVRPQKASIASMGQRSRNQLQSATVSHAVQKSAKRDWSKASL